jgi:hypothetical protein
MKLNQKGFGAIESLLVLIAITLIVGVGFYVFNANKDKKDQDKTNISTSSPSDSSEQKSVDPLAAWITFSDKDPANGAYAGAASGGDSEPLSFKYPPAWKPYAINSSVTINGSTQELGANTLVPDGKATSITFESYPQTGYENLTAEQYFKKHQANNPTTTGPNWQSMESFTTKNGYTAHTSKLVSGGMTRYSITVVNGKSIANFGYDNTEEQYALTIKQIVDTLRFL